MEKTYKRVPFDVELAKKIQSGEVEGRIVTGSGAEVHIVEFDRVGNAPPLTVMLPIQCYRLMEREVEVESDGKILGCIDRLFIELPEETPKTQADLCEDWWLEEQKRKPYIKQLLKLKDYTKQLMEVNQGVIDNLDNLVQDLKRICEPPEQKHEFKVGDKVSYAGIMGNITKIDKNLVDIDPVICGIFHNVSIFEIELVEEAPKQDSFTKKLHDTAEVLATPKHEFEPFDKVLVRNSNSSIWVPRLYSYRRNGAHYAQDGIQYQQVIQYEGNENLVGTTNNPNKR